LPYIFRQPSQVDCRKQDDVRLGIFPLQAHNRTVV
jgi:hypothetical protein